MTPQPDPLRILIVDDELPARQRIGDLLRREGERFIIQEAADGREAVRLILSEGPLDLIFLDIQMPELNGFAVVEAIGSARLPLTVFVTAYDEHAIRAFETNALDYLLKPFSDERFGATLARAEARLAERDAGAFARGMARLFTLAAGPSQRRPDRLLVRARGAIRFVRTDEIERIEGAGPYVNLHVQAETLLHRASLTELGKVLEPRRFLRIHKSTIINIEHVVQLEPTSHGEFEALLTSGARCRVSRTHRSALEERLQQKL
ncbi:LytR/AlgR family response regulator transcription factor [Lichenicoccus roseus]|uniref:Response regulator transcription factor n=1 Tax=Lichenicoccus roseus TaxID=2683649 RepID=A0A5R9J116_9PROT|nr:LytTR family DNA-binding domain-containing protein [Lichenicoccus roseus]TLU70533.1 response regulator transcription factor [Lichenicoccus roseus]